MSAAIVEFETHTGFPPMPLDDGPKVPLGLFVSTAEKNEIQILRKQVIQNADDQIKTLLNVDPGDHCQQRPVGVGIVEFELLEESFLVLQFCRKVARAVGRGYQSVGLR